MYGPTNYQTPIKVIPYYKSTVKSFSTNENISQTSVVYDINDTIICFFADLLGKETIVIPKDTISVTFKERQISKEGIKINKLYNAYWKHEFDYKGKNEYIYKLLDSLTYFSGYVYKDFIRFQANTYSLSSFYDTVTYRYQVRTKFIDDYCSKYSLPDNIKQLVKAECYAAYILNLLAPFPKASSLPSNYDSTLKSTSLNSKYVFKTPLYADAVLEYIEEYKTKYENKLSNDEDVVKSTYYNIGNEFKDCSTREFLQSRYLISNFSKSYTAFDSLYQNFTESFPHSSRTPIIDSMLQVKRNSQKLTFEDVLNSTVIDTSMAEKKLKDILHEKQLTIIDCWATWCGPCIKEIPFSEKLKNEYKGKLKMIYLSFDYTTYAWKTKQPLLGIKENSFMLKGDFKSDFASFFDITSIPRYILIGRDGKIINSDAPRPSKQLLKDLIEKYLNE